MIKGCLEEFGFSKVDINLVINNKKIKELREETVSRNIKEINTYFIEKGHFQYDIVKMVRLFPRIYTYTLSNIKTKIDYLKKVRISRKKSRKYVSKKS